MVEEGGVVVEMVEEGGFTVWSDKGCEEGDSGRETIINRKFFVSQ